jgi:hypothetical protein
VSTDNGLVSTQGDGTCALAESSASTTDAKNRGARRAILNVQGMAINC